MTLIFCKCGCGKKRKEYDRFGIKREFIYGHTFPSKKGIKLTEEHKHKISLYSRNKKLSPQHIEALRQSQLGEKHHNWSGDNVTYAAVHKWVRKHLPAPKFCQICDFMPPHDLANVTGIYNREFKNWKYLCRKCHMISDGRMEKMSELYKRNKRFQES